MRKELIAALAVVGTVATVGYLNAETFSESSSFLSISGPEAAFNQYIARFGKSYGTKEEYNFRLQQFLENYHLVQSHNAENASDHGFFMGLNQFSDWHQKEFEGILGLNVPSTSSNNAPVYQTVRSLPQSVNWL